MDKCTVIGLRKWRPDGGTLQWFYVAGCNRCSWSFNWDGAADWELVHAAAYFHYWLYADTDTCLTGLP